MKIRTVEKDRENDRFCGVGKMNKEQRLGGLSTANLIRSDNLSTDLLTIVHFYVADLA